MPADGSRPDADYYEAALRELCEAAAPLRVIVRSLDLAGDKRPAWLDPIAGMEDLLGLRGSRLYGREPVRGVFHDQVRAVGRLRGDYDIALMLPYIVRRSEYLRWRAEIEGLIGTGTAVGTMAETPAAALAIDDWLRAADFMSIGCNDLMQCLFGAQRDVPELAGLLDPYSPVLFRYFAHVAELAGPRVGEVQLCGLLAKVPRILPVLLGLGYRNFSVEPHLIPHLARAVMGYTSDTTRALAGAVCAAQDTSEVYTLLGLRGSEIDPWHGDLPPEAGGATRYSS